MVKSSIHHDKKKCDFDYLSTYRKDEVILAMTENTGRCGILTKGRAHISAVDEAGTDNILEYLSEGSSFSEYYTLLPENQTGYVIADTDCTVRFINMARVLGGCSGGCGHHEEVMKDLVLMSASHSREQSVRMNILSRRSLREKLMAYLSFQQMYVAGMDEITIPLSLSALAEYLCVDRSAMMREIKRMNDDGLICSQGRKFTILEKFRGD